MKKVGDVTFFGFMFLAVLSAYLVMTYAPAVIAQVREYSDISVNYGAWPKNEIPQQEIDASFEVGCLNQTQDRFIVAVVDPGNEIWVQGHSPLTWTSKGSGEFRYVATGKIHLWVGAKGNEGAGAKVKVKFFLVDRDTLFNFLEQFPPGKKNQYSEFERFNLQDKAEATYPKGSGWETISRGINPPAVVPAVGWAVQNAADNQGVRSVNYDSREQSLLVTCDLRGKDPNNSRGEIFLDLHGFYAIKGMLPIDMRNYTITAEFDIPQGFVGPVAAPNGIQLFVKDDNYKSLYGSWTNIVAPGRITIDLKPANRSPVNGYMDSDFNPTRIVWIGIKFAINDKSSANYQGEIKVKKFEINPSLPF
jgi:hypothetical protein